MHTEGQDGNKSKNDNTHSGTRQKQVTEWATHLVRQDSNKSRRMVAHTHWDKMTTNHTMLIHKRGQDNDQKMLTHKGKG